MAELKEILSSIKAKFGEKRVSKKHGTEYLSIPKESRKEAIGCLVQTLKDSGKDRSLFSQSTFRLTVAEWLFPEALTQFWDKNKRRGAFEVVWRELDEVVADSFSVELSDAAPKERISNEYDPSKHKSFAKELDRSLLADAPKSTTLIDDEMSKLLGYDDE